MLEINVVGNSDLKQRVVVGLDVDVQLNLAGPIPAVGLTLQELRGQICTALSRKVLKQRTPDGRETVETIEPDDAQKVVDWLYENRESKTTEGMKRVKRKAGED